MTSTFGGHAAMHNSQPLHLSSSMTSVPRLTRCVLIAVPPLLSDHRCPTIAVPSWLSTPALQHAQQPSVHGGRLGDLAPGAYVDRVAFRRGQDAAAPKGVHGVVGGEQNVLQGG